MSEPIVLSTSCLPESGSVLPRFNCAGRLLCEVKSGSEVAGAVIRFIQRRFLQAYDALPNLRIPSLLALTTGQGSLLAAVGVRRASEERLFLEDYTGRPIEQLIPSLAQPDRSEIAEIAHLAGVEAGASRYLFPALTVWLKAEGYRWIAFTGTEQVRNSFNHLGIRIHGLGPANPDCLPDGGHGWGRYYENRPRVMAANVDEGYLALQERRLLGRIRPWRAEGDTGGAGRYGCIA
ncbi:MAG: thermostable hemolysin [Marinobacter sp.]|uniref:thermostable hemolysin n=1 Tax=Marinobacter sp. TaxID=50741 RepID=UPI00299EF55B|nr:thermostable hemolysin [Marinobacter sp.]MDX1755324.1 thermostable hemolysin [Marinobacter sp.]